ncbi:MAG: hypothetical protein H6845_01740 [Alphaproteobacteria bacterium]|nr:MAG: hypothetical protein H6845_01740 [Alphaproteobacteria bacterium]
MTASMYASDNGNKDYKSYFRMLMGRAAKQKEKLVDTGCICNVGLLWSMFDMNKMILGLVLVNSLSCGHGYTPLMIASQHGQY